MNSRDSKKLCLLIKNTLQLESEEGIELLSKSNCPKWDSLAQMSLVAVLENEFSISIEIDDFEKLTSFVSIKLMLEEKGS